MPTTLKPQGPDARLGSVSRVGSRRKESVADGLRETPRPWRSDDYQWLADLTAEESQPLIDSDPAPAPLGPRTQTPEHPDAREHIEDLLARRSRAE